VSESAAKVRKRSNSNVDNPQQEPNQCSQAQRSEGRKWQSKVTSSHRLTKWLCGRMWANNSKYSCLRVYTRFQRIRTFIYMQMQTDLQLTPIRIHMYTFCRIFDYDLQDSYDVTKTSPELYLIGFSTGLVPVTSHESRFRSMFILTAKLVL